MWLAVHVGEHVRRPVSGAAASWEGLHHKQSVGVPLTALRETFSALCRYCVHVAAAVVFQCPGLAVASAKSISRALVADVREASQRGVLASQKNCTLGTAACGPSISEHV